MAQSSFKKVVIGIFARLLKAIPVVRPQDLIKPGSGVLTLGQDRMTLAGENTFFLNEIAIGDTICLSKQVKIKVLEINSNNQLRLEEPMNEAVIQCLKNSKRFQIMPRVDQNSLFEKVKEHFSSGQSLVIFPEGGSHDCSEMLPFKAGFSIMALNAMAKNRDLDLVIVPVGLNYFHPHRFRSRVTVSYGRPITVQEKWVQNYGKGGLLKRKAICSLLEAGYLGLQKVTVNAPNPSLLRTMEMFQCLYQQPEQLSLNKTVELKRELLLNHRRFERDSQWTDILERIRAYQNSLKYFGLTDYHITQVHISTPSALLLLLYRFLKFSIFAILGFPSLFIHSPLLILSLVVSQRKRKEALACSSVKITARDVLATWKILVTSLGLPVLYALYSWIFWTYCVQHDYWQSLWVFLWILLPFQYGSILIVDKAIDIYRSLVPLMFALRYPNESIELWNMRCVLSETVTHFVMRKQNQGTI
ncbi:hypothetical protein BY458DRAFT_540483 [Sporodiniella umbellata]|nr:hypothetical protein BY458DRAFT_540483 [Sporodiniella umbellata]